MSAARLLPYLDFSYQQSLSNQEKSRPGLVKTNNHHNLFSVQYTLKMFLLSVAPTLEVCKENRTICSELVLWLQKRRVGPKVGDGGGAVMHCTAQYSFHDNEVYSSVHMTDRFRELEPSLETVQLTL